MAEIRWTQQAASDLEEITSFIAQDSEYYASFFASKVLDSVERLNDFLHQVELYLSPATPRSEKLFLETTELFID